MNEFSICTENFKICKSEEFYYVPGSYQIDVSERCFEEFEEEYVSELSNIIRTLRCILWELDVKVVGIYIQPNKEKRMVVILPYHVSILEKLKISTDDYQLDIEKYLEYMSTVKSEEFEDYDKLVSCRFMRYYSKPELFDKKYKTFIEDSKTTRRLYDTPNIIETYVGEEVPDPPEGQKYFVCIGGEKDYQYYLETKTMSRGEFLEQYKDDLPYILRPIYEDNDIIIRQDPQFAIPGFFIISPKILYRNLAYCPYEIYRKSMIFSFALLRFLSKQSDITMVYLYYDERHKKKSSAHFWVLPIFTNCYEGDLTYADTTIWKYVDHFLYSNNKKRIEELVLKIKEYMNNFPKL